MGNSSMTKTAFSKQGKILMAAVGLAGVALALTGCAGSPDVDGTYFAHHNNDSAQAVISGSTIELYISDGEHAVRDADLALAYAEHRLEELQGVER